MWEKPGPCHVKTWKLGVYIPTHQEMGVWEEIASRASPHQMLGTSLRLEDLQSVRIPYYDTNQATLDDFILEWEHFAEEVVGDMRQEMRDKWACRTFPHPLASELQGEFQFRRRGSVRRSNTQIGWSKKKDWALQTKRWRIFGQYSSASSVEGCG